MSRHTKTHCSMTTGHLQASLHCRHKLSAQVCLPTHHNTWVHLLLSPLRIHTSPPIFTTMGRQQAFGHVYPLPLPCHARTHTHPDTAAAIHTTHTEFGFIMDAMRTKELPSSDALQLAVEFIGCCARHYVLWCEVRTSSSSAARCLGVSTGRRNGLAMRTY